MITVTEDSMFELVQVSENCYYIQNPAKIGLVKLNDNNVCLIDSGNDKEAGRKVRQILDKNGWHLTAIYNTHFHADHVGGNRYLQSQTGCKAYLPEIECGFARHTILEPSFLYGGSPMESLCHKFLMAQDSDCDYLTDDVLPKNLSSIPLPGHSPGMVGYRTSDDIVFLADCLSSVETLKKYTIGYVYDIESYLSTLKTVKDMKASMFIPAHVEATEDISELAQYNIDATLEVADHIEEICKTPISTESVVKRIFDDYSLRMTMEEYVLISSTVRSYLSWLESKGRIAHDTADNMLTWCAKS